MPYVKIDVTRDGVMLAQKEALIQGATDLLVQVLDKDPATTFVVIEEIETDKRGIAGKTGTRRRQLAASEGAK